MTCTSVPDRRPRPATEKMNVIDECQLDDCLAGLFARRIDPPEHRAQRLVRSYATATDRLRYCREQSSLYPRGTPMLVIVRRDLNVKL